MGSAQALRQHELAHQRVEEDDFEVVVAKPARLYSDTVEDFKDAIDLFDSGDVSKRRFTSVEE